MSPSLCDERRNNILIVADTRRGRGPRTIEGEVQHQPGGTHEGVTGHGPPTATCNACSLTGDTQGGHGQSKARRRGTHHGGAHEMATGHEQPKAMNGTMAHARGDHDGGHGQPKARCGTHPHRPCATIEHPASISRPPWGRRAVKCPAGLPSCWCFLSLCCSSSCLLFPASCLSSPASLILSTGGPRRNKNTQGGGSLNLLAAPGCPRLPVGTLTDGQDGPRVPPKSAPRGPNQDGPG